MKRKRSNPARISGSSSWYRAGLAGAKIYVVGAPLFMFIMAIEESAAFLQNLAWMLALVGLAVFASLFARLRYLNSAIPKASEYAVLGNARPEDTRLELTVVAWSNLAIFALCGLVWVFAQKTQCLLQGWILDTPKAAACL